MSEIRLPYFEVLSVTPQAPPPIPYGVKMIGAELEWPETQGEKVRVAVVDTGIAEHPDLKLAGFFDATNPGAKQSRDINGHGTHCAGIVGACGKIKGVAPLVDLYTVRIFDDQSRTTEDIIARGLEWCLANSIDVVSMSFGGPRPMPKVHEAIKKLYARGTVLVAAAGNFGRDFPEMWPAAYPEVISVAAVDVNKEHAQWSSWHKTVELSAAGVEVYSTYLGGQYALLSGTSMACPHISGAVALMIAKRRIRGLPVTPVLIRDSMAIYADDLGPRGRDEKYGYGLFSFGRVEGAAPAPDRPPIDLEFKVGQKSYWRNGQLNTALTAPRILEDDRAYLGMRDVGDALGCKTDWIPPDTIRIKG